MTDLDAVVCEDFDRLFPLRLSYILLYSHCVLGIIIQQKAVRGNLSQTRNRH